MTIQELKQSIENHTYNYPLVILVINLKETVSFLCNQYVHEILCQQNKDIVAVNDVQSIVAHRSNIFNMSDDFVYCKTDIFKYTSSKLLEYKDILIVCEKVDNETKKIYNDNIVVLPELEQWHLKDFVNSRCSLSEKSVDYLLDKCKSIYRLNNEIEKVCIFPKENHGAIFNDLCKDDFLSDSVDYDIFSLVNPIVNKSYSELAKVWEDVKLFDSDPMYLLSVLISQYKVMIDVFLYPNSTPETCGISSKRFNAIKYYNKNYTKNQLVEVYRFLTSVDRRLKMGELPNEDLLDFIIINVIQKGNL